MKKPDRPRSVGYLCSNFDLSARDAGDAGDAVSAFLKESLAKNFPYGVL